MTDEKRVLERKIDIELGEIKGNSEAESPKNKTQRAQSEEDYNWSIGCLGKLDKRCITYFSQMSIIATCVGVSLYKISSMADEKEKQFWIALLCSSIGYVLPQPQLKK